MPNLYFILFELMVYVLFAAALAHAWRKGPAVAWQLAAGVLFGVLLEWATIRQLHAYRYGRFLIMLGDVPLPIGVAWGTIVYSVRQFSDATSLPGWARPVLDGLLALNIDLAMDTIAIRLGFWNWSIGIYQQFFGVPYGNFWAWFWVVFSFSGGLRLLLLWKNPIGKWIAPFGAIPIGVAGVLITNRLIYNLAGNYPLYLAVIAVVLFGALFLVLALRPRLHTRPTPALAALTPGGFHAYFLLVGLVSGVIFQPPFLLFVSLSMIVAAFILHRKQLKASSADAALMVE